MESNEAPGLGEEASPLQSCTVMDSSTIGTGFVSEVGLSSRCTLQYSHTQDDGPYSRPVRN